MLKKLLNQCIFEMRLETREPLLIKSGSSVVSGPDMSFVRTNRGGSVEPYIPGSSLKGALRSHAERIARTLKRESVCGVFESAGVTGCGWRIENSHDESDYRESCPACRLFGSTLWKGRFRTGDAYLIEEDRDVNPELRDGIGIDRVSGGVAGGAKFDLEVMPAGVTFTTQFELVNFEAWQLGWTAYVVRDLMEERIRLGMGTARGLGRVRGHLDAVTIEYVGEPSALKEGLPGIGALSTDEEQEAYGFAENDVAERPDGLSLTRPRGALRAQARLEDESKQHELLSSVAGAWDRYIRSVDPIG
ncbi:MAG: CRISPR-associated RAMP protein Csx7 [Salinibacter sp.]